MNPRVAAAATGAAERSPADWLTLVRPRVAVFVVFGAFVGGLLATGPGTAALPVAVAAVFVGCTAAAASVFNQVIERDTDARMGRTADRPLPTGRLRVRDAIFFGAALAVVGVAGLALAFNLLAALLAVSTMASYTLVYTPLKRHSTFNTLVGAIPGAMPPMLGYAAIAGEVGPWAWALFGIQFAWQFPHFFAIAWLYRADYAKAGMRMLSAGPGEEGMAGRQALAYAVALLALSILPAANRMAGPVYAIAALALGLAYVVASAAFALRETRTRARAVLLVSLVYLPLILTFVLLDPVVRLGTS